MSSVIAESTTSSRSSPFFFKNSDNDFNTLYRKLFNALEKRLEPASIPACVLFIADYQYKSAFAMDAEINFVACLTEIMSECKFK